MLHSRCRNFTYPDPVGPNPDEPGPDVNNPEINPERDPKPLRLKEGE
jgi:hypothetical protein